MSLFKWQAPYPDLVLLRVSWECYLQTHRMIGLIVVGRSLQGQTQPGFPHPQAHTWIFTFPILHPFLFHVQPSPLPFAVPRPHHSKKLTKACSVVLPTKLCHVWPWDLGDPGTKESSFLTNTQTLALTASPTPGQGTGPGDPSNFIENQTKRG